MPKLGKEYEELIDEIYNQLLPSAIVTKNDKIIGRYSKIPREIDVSIRSEIGNKNYLMIVQAKDYKTPADIKTIGEFASVIEDVNATKGILICAAGFTKTVKTYALNKGIELYSAHDAKSIKWLTELKLPVTMSCIGIWGSLKFGFQGTKETEGKPLTIRQDELYGDIFYDKDGNQTSFMNEFIKRYDDGSIRKTPGNYAFDLLQDKMMVKLSNNLIPVNKFLAEYDIKFKYFFKYFTIDDYQGLREAISNKFIYTRLGIKDFLVLDDTWQQIESPDSIVVNSERIEYDDFYFFFKGIRRITMHL
ncbi:hypothetical protein GS399_09685 [Pedobacter sp. HMF7647]|uniref:Restriction endonuclease type IV Mrr domain-containing protein n=1 Tax=Hufsiella arboris TaxID=2695275 RepID=A0A7K1YAV6_9SPHI|nr:restriction endonuclease [Hufsiella arboris]MXV51239.1 hypothetical protein [Hufsiella arboris]